MMRSQRTLSGARCSLPCLSLPSLRHSDGYLVVYKQHDLHMDHPEESVTLATMLNANFPDLADAKTALATAFSAKDEMSTMLVSLTSQQLYDMID